MNKNAKVFKSRCYRTRKSTKFLNLIIDSDEDKKIYLDRWESVKDAKVFSKNARKGFATTFKREEFKDIATRTKEAR